MYNTVVFAVLNAKYVHASPAPFCLAAGVRAHAAELFNRVRTVESTVNHPLEDTLSQIIAHSPAVVGFSCYIWNIRTVLCLCTAIKRELPEVIIILGGPEVSFCANEVLKKNPDIDYILSGEGEESVPLFLRAVFTQNKPALLPEHIGMSIAGLCGRRSDGSIYENSTVSLKYAVPSPLTAGYKEAIKGRIAYLETSRGCPYSCAFCLSGRGDKPRYFSLASVFDDLIHLANSGTRTIKLVDRTFNADANHANNILQFILKNYGNEIPRGICFHFEIAGDILREETFTLLSQMPAGAVQLEIGMQSFCEETLKAVGRKTNTEALQNNIRRLVAMRNMHIHIDLIAGLPYESIAEFERSFNKGYVLGANTLQLGFLKLLYGSAMRNEPHSFPCEYYEDAPYEVKSTPWLSAENITSLHRMEDAVDRVYNSGRFFLSAAYVIEKSGLSPFEFYMGLGNAAHKSGLCHTVSLDDYTAFLQEYCLSLPGVDALVLRDLLTKDRLAVNSTGRLPACLYRKDERFSGIVKALSGNKDTAPKKGVRRGIAILYSQNAVCYADYEEGEQDPVTGRYKLHKLLL